MTISRGRRAAVRAMRRRAALALCVYLQWHLLLAVTGLTAQAAALTSETISGPARMHESAWVPRGTAALECVQATHESARGPALHRDGWPATAAATAPRKSISRTPRTAYPPRKRLRRNLARADDDPPA